MMSKKVRIEITSSHDGKDPAHKVTQTEGRASTIPTEEVYVLSQNYHDGFNTNDDLLAKGKDKSVASEIVEVQKRDSKEKNNEISENQISRATNYEGQEQ